MNAPVLDGRVAVVTGGGAGIGRAISIDLAANGAKVVVADRTDPLAVVDEIRSAGHDAIAATADVTSESDMDDVVREAVRVFGGIDALVNNAGVFASLQQRPFEQIPLDEWRLVFDVNVLGSAVAARAVLPHMRRRSGGSIVNIASTTAFKGSALPHYSASKGAILALTKNLARELGADDIRVNAVAPGFTVSAGVEDNPGETARMRANAAGGRVLHREMIPNDVVGAVRFLSSTDADFITGQTLVVDGGAYFH